MRVFRCSKMVFQISNLSVSFKILAIFNSRNTRILNPRLSPKMFVFAKQINKIEQVKLKVRLSL